MPPPSRLSGPFSRLRRRWRRWLRVRRTPPTPFAEVSFLAIDLETTGLDPVADHIVAMGWVPIDRGEIVLAGAGRRLVRPPVPVGESATIHGLTDELLRDSAPLTDALPVLLGELEGRVLVAHHAPFDVGFLARAAEGFETSYVDTLAVERRLHDEVDLPRGSLRLGAARERHGLPAYAAHDALTDALAAAELLLAQVADLERRNGRPVTLRDLAR